jgi:hypothetical protein
MQLCVIFRMNYVIFSYKIVKLVKETYAWLNVAFSDEALSLSVTCESHLYLKVVKKCDGVAMSI